TREVSRDLNFIGILSLSCWVIDLAVDWSRSQRWVRTGRLILLLVTILILVWLFPAHDRLGRQVDAGLAGTRVFYLQHRNYLIAISVQWGVNLLLLAVSLASWTHVFGPRVRPETLPDRALTAPSLSLEWTHQSSSSEDSPPL
ncbi:MAG TPA: hypothetical protein VFT74_19310, partial [Isosphaeraceae bacterium]|nr:hypothetical protein [Isosphaeraceae bacterium]